MLTLTFVLSGGFAVAERRRTRRLRHVAANTAAVVEDAYRPRGWTSRRQGGAAHNPRGGHIVVARSAGGVACQNKRNKCSQTEYQENSSRT